MLISVEILPLVQFFFLCDGLLNIICLYYLQAFSKLCAIYIELIEITDMLLGGGPKLAHLTYLNASFEK